MTQSNHISWQVNVSLRCTSISPKTSETKLQVSEAQLQVFSPWAPRHFRSIVWMRIFKARLLAAWPLAQWCASFGGLAETFSRKVSRWVKPRFFCKKKSFTQNYNFRCNMQPIWIQSKVETDPIYIICPSLRRFFSMFKNSIFMSCFHLYMAPSQRGRTLPSSFWSKMTVRQTRSSQVLITHTACPSALIFRHLLILKITITSPKISFQLFLIRRAWWSSLCSCHLRFGSFWNIPVFAKYQSSSASAWDMTSGICSHRRGESLEVFEASSSFTIAIFVDGYVYGVALSVPG